MSRSLDNESYDNDGYQVDHRQHRTVKPPQRRRSRTTRANSLPKAFNGIHRRRRKKIL